MRMCISGLLFLVVSAVGCGGNDNPPTAPVTGNVTFKGQPLAKGEIVFYPEKGRTARGAIEQGKIVNVSTNDPEDGAPLGDLKVAIFATEPDTSDTSGMGVKSLIPVKYNDPVKSGLTMTVKEGTENSQDFTLTE